MLTGMHAMIFAEDAETARAFVRDVLGFPCVDSGGGWLIFAAPPTELAFHPGPGWKQEEGQHILFLMCDDLEATMGELEAKGVEFVEPATDEGFGLMTRFKIPGAGDIGLYQPSHPSPLSADSGAS